MVGVAAHRHHRPLLCSDAGGIGDVLLLQVHRPPQERRRRYSGASVTVTLVVAGRPVAACMAHIIPRACPKYRKQRTGSFVRAPAASTARSVRFSLYEGQGASPNFAKFGSPCVGYVGMSVDIGSRQLGC